jgi:hypothetical protein
MDRYYVGWETPIQWFEDGPSAGPQQEPPFDFVYFPDRANTWKDQDEKTYSCKGIVESASQARVYELIKRVFGDHVIISFAKELTPDLEEHFQRTQEMQGAVMYVCFDEVT